MRTSTVFGLLFAAFASVTTAASAQPGRGPSPVAKNMQALPVDPAPSYVRKDAPTDPIILKLWEEGMQRSHAGSLAQALLDSVGPRLTGSPNMNRAQDWLLATYKQFGVSAR